MDPVSGTLATLEFGRFKVDVFRRELYADNRLVALGSRAFDVLLALIDARGSILSKDEIMGFAWPGRVVEENSLQAQISVLRTALGEDRDLIRTVAGRGYQFAGQLRSSAVRSLSAQIETNLPASTSDLIGRDDLLAEVTAFITKHRIVTLTGEGGIGKTKLALAAGRHVLPSFADGVCLAELAPLANEALVSDTIFAAMGLKFSGGVASLENFAKSLGSKHTLLIIDNCEHVIDSVARMVDLMARANPNLHMLATSREPLRAEGEYVYRVPALDMPAEDVQDPAALRQYGAVKLFVARANAIEDKFSKNSQSIAIVATICRHLDGIPLAIELAAARAATLGLDAIASRLDDRLTFLTGGRRTALHRHQTLRATLDWSYDLLLAPERELLNRWAIFAGSFTLEAACALVENDETSPSDAVDILANLVSKSLVYSDVSGERVYYRLLETTRVYALEKLNANGERQKYARRHAEYYQALFQRADSEWETQPTKAWLETYRRKLDNVRAALDWAYSDKGDQTIGSVLTVAAVALWTELSLMDECRRRVETALSFVETGLDLNPRGKMHLYAALGWSLMYTKGAMRETGAAWTRTLELAIELGDNDYQLRALWGLWASHINNGKFAAALVLAKRFFEVAQNSTDPFVSPIGDRMMGVSLHFQGDERGAQRHIERMLDRYIPPKHRSHVVRFQFEQRVTARITFSQVIWLQGFVDRALRTVKSNIDEALSINHPLTLCNALAQSACPVALFVGDLIAAEHYIDLLLQQASKHGFDFWHAYGRCFKGMLLNKRGNFETGIAILREAIDELREAQFVQYLTTFLGSLAESLANAGAIEQGLATIDEALARSDQSEERWGLPELLRIKGAIVLLTGKPTSEIDGEALFLAGMEKARKQSALFWELRCAMNICQLWRGQEKAREARDLLASVFSKFTEGFDSSDLVAGKALLDAS